MTLQSLAGFVADLERTDYLSSAGLGVFLRTHKRLTHEGHVLRLVHVAPRVRNVFELAGFDRIRFEELRYLEDAIGRTGMLAIMPFVRAGGRDAWQLEMLRRHSRSSGASSVG